MMPNEESRKAICAFVGVMNVLMILIIPKPGHTDETSGDVVGEGVETQQQLAFLLANQCDAMQGYYFPRALPGEDAIRLLVEGRHLTVSELRLRRG
jgi:hypothetical protein